MVLLHLTLGPLFDVYSHLIRNYFIAVKQNIDDLFMYIIALHQLFYGITFCNRFSPNLPPGISTASQISP